MISFVIKETYNKLQRLRTKLDKVLPIDLAVDIDRQIQYLLNPDQPKDTFNNRIYEVSKLISQHSQLINIINTDSEEINIGTRSFDLGGNPTPQKVHHDELFICPKYPEECSYSQYLLYKDQVMTCPNHKTERLVPYSRNQQRGSHA